MEERASGKGHRRLIGLQLVRKNKGLSGSRELERKALKQRRLSLWGNEPSCSVGGQDKHMRGMRHEVGKLIWGEAG